MRFVREPKRKAGRYKHRGCLCIKGLQPGCDSLLVLFSVFTYELPSEMERLCTRPRTQRICKQTHKNALVHRDPGRANGLFLDRLQTVMTTRVLEPRFSYENASTE